MKSSVKSKKAREYYLSLLGVVGEIPSLHASVLAPAPPTTAGDELRSMLGSGLIRYHRHADRVRTFMISDPAGFDEIGKIDPRLLAHAEIMTGKKGSRYPGSKEYRIKKRKESVLMHSMLECGFIVDGARYDDEKHLVIPSPDMTNAEKIIESTGEDDILFLSGLLLKKRNASVSLTRREMSTSTGALFTPGGIYITYSIGTSRYRWYQAAELSTAVEITRLYDSVKEARRRSDGRYRAIIYADTDKIAAELLEVSGKDSRKMDPTAIYRLTYLVPTEDRSLSMDITRMLAIPDWRKRSDAVLGFTPSGKQDGKTEDGRNVYNLLCCNMAKIGEIKAEISRGKSKLIVHDWQKPVIEEMCGTEIDGIVLSARHFKGLLAAVQEGL